MELPRAGARQVGLPRSRGASSGPKTAGSGGARDLTKFLEMFHEWEAETIPIAEAWSEQVPLESRQLYQTLNVPLFQKLTEAAGLQDERLMETPWFFQVLALFAKLTSQNALWMQKKPTESGKVAKLETQEMGERAERAEKCLFERMRAAWFNEQAVPCAKLLLTGKTH